MTHTAQVDLTDDADDDDDDVKDLNQGVSVSWNDTMTSSREQEHVFAAITPMIGSVWTMSVVGAGSHGSNVSPTQ